MKNNDIMKLNTPFGKDIVCTEKDLVFNSTDPKFLLKVRYLNDEVSRISLPREGDIGIDLYSNENLEMRVGEVALISTGISVQLPKGFALEIKDRSSTSKYIHTLAGIVDNSYRGIIKVRLYCVGTNFQKEELVNYPVSFKRTVNMCKINKGDRIAQALIIRDFSDMFRLEEVDELDSTERGDKGFGSTGK